MSIKNIAVLLFHDVELLDFAGPLQVFSSLNYVLKDEQINVITIGLAAEIRVSKLGMTVHPDMVITDVNDAIDLLIIPGGFGTRPIIKDDDTLVLIEKLISKSERIASVCTGSLVLAKLGMLSHKKATTHYAAVDILTQLDPTIEVDRSKRYHDYDKIIVSEGVSAGIDMSFHFIARHFGADTADTVRKYIEYYPEPYDKH